MSRKKTYGENSGDEDEASKDRKIRMKIPSRLSPLAKMDDLFDLKYAIEGKERRVNTTQLEKDFISFSAYCPEHTLTVKIPRLYSVEGEERKHLAAALGAAPESNGSTLPKEIDISGYFPGTKLPRRLVFLSASQFESDHDTASRSYLNPLLEQVYGSGATLLRDFSLHEALCGELSCRRGELELEEAALFPHKFSSGSYTLRTKLDTPARTLQKFQELEKLLMEAEASPAEFMLNPEKMEGATKKALELRQRLGSLSRYRSPENTAFEAEVNSVILRRHENTLFYLYSPALQRNFLVYFGKNPFSEVREPSELVVLKGKEHQHTLAKLVEYDFFLPSGEVLNDRIKVMRSAYEEACRKNETAAPGATSDYRELLENLSKAEATLERIGLPERRKEYVLNLPKEWLEFLVYPATEDPIVHELLPRLSWNREVRRYHNSGKFKYLFHEADSEGRKELLQKVTANLLFRHQQNNDVNLWLYQNYQKECEEAGITFEVVK